ncbi:hypothetical protein FOXYSP1_20645 [Fusarium oxysporum f. sp. phaseoli]
MALSHLSCKPPRRRALMNSLSLWIRFTPLSNFPSSLLSPSILRLRKPLLISL